MRCGCAAVLIVMALVHGGSLRQQFDAAAADGFSAEEVVAISQAAFSLADGAGDRSRFWNTVGLIAELCAAAPHQHTREVRARALELLVERYTDTNRWSSLLSDRFAPDLQQIPQSAWADELAAYDAVLDELREKTTNERIRSELLHARIVPRVEINRRWDWLTDADRRAAIALLDESQRLYGAQPCPGGRGPDAETVNDRAANYRYELERLYFGAPAPPLVGTDLAGQPFDAAELEGRIVVLDFWTSFCQPCLEMVPDVRRLLEELAGQPVSYVGINGDVDREQARLTAEQLHMSWRNLWDGPQGTEGPNATTWHVGEMGWPAIFVLDPQGHIRGKYWGENGTIDQLRPALRSLLDETD